ncbi:MAG: hypothetical protein ACK54L_02750, partial [Betaproteobacteria bacterium]
MRQGTIIRERPPPGALAHGGCRVRLCQARRGSGVRGRWAIIARSMNDSAPQPALDAAATAGVTADVPPQIVS